MIDHCVQYGGLGGSGRLLEIGAGTGKATQAFVDRGFDITAIEPDPEMMAIARRTLDPYVEQLSFIESSFGEAVTSGQVEGPFDGVYAAMAWRWLVPQEEVVIKAHWLLRPTGCLAILENLQFVSDGNGDEFINDLVRVMGCHMPAMKGVRASLRPFAKPVPVSEKYFDQIFFVLNAGNSTLHRSFIRFWQTLQRDMMDYQLLPRQIS